MRVLRFTGILLCVGISLLAMGDRKSLAVSMPFWSHHKFTQPVLAGVRATCVNVVMASGKAPQTACADCTDKCQSHIDACKNGSQAECYLAAACLCQCNLDAGGCGSDRDALQKCVDDNTKAAKALQDNQ